MPQSVAQQFFTGKPFEDWKKGREAEAKTQVGIVAGLNQIIRGLGAIAGRR